MGWRMRLDLEGDDEPRRGRSTVVLIVVLATVWVVAVTVLAVWASRLVVR
jgi:flagellar basal body-associated protein FliL